MRPQHSCLENETALGRIEDEAQMGASELLCDRQNVP